MTEQKEKDLTLPDSCVDLGDGFFLGPDGRVVPPSVREDVLYLASFVPAQCSTHEGLLKILRSAKKHINVSLNYPDYHAVLTDLGRRRLKRCELGFGKVGLACVEVLGPFGPCYVALEVALAKVIAKIIDGAAS